MINYMEVTQVISKSSKCCRLQVGAVIVKEGRIVSTGYNGLPSGYNDSVCNFSCPGCEETIHAEMNAILFAAKKGISTEGATMYITHAPCTNCAKHIVNSGIIRVIYLNDYRDRKGVDLLRRSKIEVLKDIRG